MRPQSEPRGPDVVHTIVVPSSWLDRGETIELDLPRNLTCAKCSGGGCDDCQRAGALSLRSRRDPVQTLQLSLPRRPAAGKASATGTMVLRIPEHGAAPAATDLPRGCLMLRVNIGNEADSSVRLVRADPHSLASSLRPEFVTRAPPEVVVRSLLIAALLLVLFVWMLHLSGWL